MTADPGKARSAMNERLEERVSAKTSAPSGQMAFARLLVERNPDAVLVVESANGAIRHVNPAAVDLFGRESGDLQGETFDVPGLQDSESETRIVRPDGESRDVVMRVVPATWEEMPAYVVFIRDVTAVKKAEEAARRARENAARIERLEEELHSLAGLSSPPRTGVTARMYGVVNLLDGFPDTFHGLVGQYGELMDLALEQQSYRVTHDISGPLKAMAEKLGFYKAGPRDVVDIHTTALKEKTMKAATSEKRKAYTGEGWIMVLELMGHLTSFYRNRAQGTGMPANRTSGDAGAIAETEKETERG